MPAGNVDFLENMIVDIAPDFSAAGRRFYGKLPSGALAYYHYFFPPAEQDYFDPYRNMSHRLGQYFKILEYSNGLVLYDKSIAIYGIGDLFSRSLNPAEMVAFSFERENILFLHGNKQAPNAIVGTVDLSIRYSIALDEDGRCLIQGEDGFVRSFDNLDDALKTILSYFGENLSFCAAVDDDRVSRIESLLRQ